MKITIGMLKSLTAIAAAAILAACGADEGWDGTSGIVDNELVPIRLTLAPSVSVDGTQGEPWGLAYEGVTRATTEESPLGSGKSVGIFIIGDDTKNLIEDYRNSNSSSTLSKIDSTYKAYGYHLKATVNNDLSLTWSGETPYYPLRRNGQNVPVWIIAYAPYENAPYESELTIDDVVKGWKHSFTDNDGTCNQAAGYAAHDQLIGYAVSDASSDAPTWISRSNNTSEASEAVYVRFKHVMSQLVFNVDTGGSELTNFSLTLEGFKSTATVDLFTSCTSGEPSVSASGEDMTLNVASVEKIGGSDGTFYCVVPPHDFSGETRPTVTVTYTGASEEKTVDIGVTKFEAGYKYTINMTRGGANL